MAHPIGEKLRCDDCGAEIEYRAACNCPPSEHEKHSHVCCGQEMRILGVESDSGKPGAQKKSAA